MSNADSVYNHFAFQPIKLFLLKQLAYEFMNRISE
jgi:hypothetical protein